MTLRIGSLCSGYGGLDLAVESVFDARTAWFVEYDRDPSAILAHHWPHVPNHGDVKTTDWSQVEPVDILTAGYPCQPFSHAGKRKGHDDPRHLWPDVARAIGALRPGLVVLENVAGHVSLGLADVLGDLSALGYDARWGVVRASDAGAPHRRERWFCIAADTDGRRSKELLRHGGLANLSVAGEHRRYGAVPNPDGAGLEGHGELHAAPREVETTPHDRRHAPHAESGGRGTRAGCGTTAGGLGESRTRDDAGIHWGVYRAGIERWEHVVGRPAPGPTEPGNGGRRRLSAPFVEWLMGLPAGHVTDAPISRTAQLKALGNGVVPQQAALALRLLLADVAVAA